MKKPSILKFAKYLPAAFCGLLVVAWIVSVFQMFGAVVRWPQANGRGVVIVSCNFGSVSFWHSPIGEGDTKLITADQAKEDFRLSRFVGQFFHNVNVQGFRLSPTDITLLTLPIPFILTLLLPVSIGCLNRFRFPLWSWFAWTALFAAECVYYFSSS